MRSRLPTTTLAIAVALAGCAHGRGREFGRQSFERIGRYDVGGGSRVTVVYDRATGCEWIWTSGRRQGQMQPRLDGGVQRCDSEPGRRGFRALSRTRVGPDAVTVIRDADTGCDWLWADGRTAAGLVPRLNAAGMICQR